MSVNGLVGREGPLASLSRAVAGMPEAGDAILLNGEPGIGKTALLLAAQELARAAGYRVIETAGSETESALSFAALHRLLRPLLTMSDALPTVQRRALLTALGMREGPPPEIFMVSLAALNLVTEASKHQPLLIAVDDLRWLDSVSREVLTFIARRIERRPIVIVATSSAAHFTPEVVDGFRELRLTRLDQAAARRLLAARRPDLDEARREWVLGHAVGNPLALVELAAVAPSVRIARPEPFSTLVPLTRALESAFAGALVALPALSRDAVLVAALDAEDNVQEILAATGLLSGQRVTVSVLDAPQSLGLLRYDDTRVKFAHPLVRFAVTQSESTNRRQAAHRALGEVVVVSSERRTWHRANGAAGGDDVVAAELEATAADSVRRGDSAAAILAWEKAAQLSTTPAERGRRLLLAAGWAADMGRFETLDRLLADATHGELSAVDGIRARLLRDDWNDKVVAGGARVAHLCATARRAAAAGEDRLALDLTCAASTSRFSAPVTPRARSEIAALARSLAHHSEDPRALSVLAVLEPVRHGRAVLDALAHTRVETPTDAVSRDALVLAACAIGDYAHAVEFLNQAEAAHRSQSLQGRLVRVLGQGVDVRLDVGDWDRAAAALIEVNSLTATSNRAVHRAEVLTIRAKAAALRGETSTALELVVEVEHDPTIRRGSPALARAQIARGIAYIAAGRHFDAYISLSRVLDPRDPSHHFREQFGAIMYLAEAAVHCGQHDGARTIVERMEATAHIAGSPLLTTHMQYARAVLAADDVAEQLFLDYLASDLAAWPWPRARSQLAYGRWLRRQRRVSQSRGPLRDALVTFQNIGATRWAEDALGELEATGHLSEDLRTAPSAAALSSQELKIARLAARGLSNSEIGQQLCLSPRTVGSHLYRIFPKLGVSGRGQIASRLLQDQVAGEISSPH